MNRRDFSANVIGTGLGALAFTLTATAGAQGATPVEGAQFTRVEPPVAPMAKGKIEVLEFFSYACPHCNSFEPAIESWAAKVPADVAFHRVPVSFLYNYENFMRTYYALETLGLVSAMQAKVFAAVHVEHLRLDKPADIAALMARNGIDSAKFLNVFNSFSVATSIARAKTLIAQYKLDGVPTLAVQGRFETSPGQAGGHEQALAVVDYLIQRVRKG